MLHRVVSIPSLYLYSIECRRLQKALEKVIFGDHFHDTFLCAISGSMNLILLAYLDFPNKNCVKCIHLVCDKLNFYWHLSIYLYI